ncbi:MAG: Maf family protein [Lachnospiraceae bacterium]|jgi:septum formation protein|nr:Maf family protein [Lachnospiraceae bacterium]MCI1726985.1 Maf family protein [Lachnospiraceae bacterium]
MKIILASASPRRARLLTQLGVSFTVMASAQAETETGNSPAEVCLTNAKIKAYDIASRLASSSGDKSAAGRESVLVLGADTVVAAGGEILGKPKDEADASRMLHLLSGRTHQVLTGVCAVLLGPESRAFPDSQKLPGRGEISFADTTDVTVAPMSDREIEEYIKSREPFDKAGGYGIQGEFAKYIVGIRGDYSNVVGLPAGRVWRECLALL